jgi:O-antigen/teichoic acid export membrane protein
MENLKEKTAKGIAWGAVNNGTTQVLNLVFGIVLARKLTEADYGIIALLTIFTALAGCIQSAGFSQALANLKPPTKQDYNAVAWFNILAGFSMYIILFFCAPLIARFFHLPMLTDVSRLVFLTIPISSIGIVPNAKLWIELRNRELAIAAIVSLIVSGCTGMWLAFHDYGYWSLAWQQVVFISVATIIKYCFTQWCPTLPIDFSPIRRMFGFSSKMLLTNMLTVISQNVLTFIFGKLLPIGMVGQFNQANKWNTMGHSFISNTMAQVAQPVLTNAGDETGRRLRVFRKMLRFTAFVSFPLMLGLALVAHEFIVITIGEKWLPAVPLLQMLCVGGAFIPLHTLYQNFVISRGRSDFYLVLVSLQIFLQIAITLCFVSQGITVMVTAFSVLNILFTLLWHYAFNRTSHLRLLDAMKDTMPFALIAAAIMVATYYATLWTDVLWLLFLLRCVIAAVLYIGVMRLLHAAVLEECLQFLFKKKPV